MTEVSMEKLFLKYSKWIEMYFENNASKLHKVADRVLKNLKFHDVDKEEFYSLASEIFVIEVLRDFDEKQDFEGFLYSCLYKKFCTEMTRRRRKKRCTRIKVRTKDSNGNVIESEEIISDVRIDAPVNNEDNSNFGEVIASNNRTEIEAMESVLDEKVERYLNSLSKIQRKIIEMKMQNIEVKVIKEKLKLTDSQYAFHMQEMVQYEHIRLLHV